MRLFPWRVLAIPVLLVLTTLFAGGCGTPSFLITPVTATYELTEQEVAPGKGFFREKVAIIELEGLLMNAKSGGLLAPTENVLSLFTQQMEMAERDPAVRAIVLRVNSPGGTVSSSDAMYQIVKRFRARTHKPVVASIQEVGASGAYYVSCAADRIVAQPTSVVGSIGVIFESMEFSGTLDKIGANSWAITSGPLKEMGSPFKPLEPRERRVMQQMVDEYFTRFIGIVSSNRPVTEKPTIQDGVVQLSSYRNVDYGGIYSGRVFSGAQGKLLGLVDETGLLSDAISLARKLGGAPGATVVMYKRPYGYTGSIYASDSAPTPKTNAMTLNLPGASNVVPAGFYFLWQPGL